MKSKWWIILLIVILLIVVLGLKRGNFGLITPNFNPTSKQTEVPNATPDSPKQYNFDSSTDLKMELESINPQILDSDFE